MGTDQSEEMGLLSLQLFGQMAVQCGNEAMPPVRSRKALYLLAMLALHANRELSRDRIAGIFWPDSDMARETLRRTLTDLRTGLGKYGAALVATRQTLCLHISENAVDVLRFDALRERDSLAAWDEAITLYRGELLEGCNELWCDEERSRRTDAYQALLERAAASHCDQNNPTTAITYLRLAIRANPFREKLYRDLMQAHVKNGAPSEAILVYRDLRLRLHEATQSEPSLETVALYRRIRTEGHTLPAPSTPAVATTTDDFPDALHSSLPRPLTGLIGREKEMAQVAERLSRSRLVTITGVGGIGKTRLAIESASCLQSRFPEGVVFVDLAVISDPALVSRTIARILDIHEEPGQDLLRSLIQRLRSRDLLLVLDNCEHLMNACKSLVRSLLMGCPDLRIMATSRQALRLTGEVVLSLLPLPASNLSEESGFSPALQLFLERAVAVRSDFVPTAGNIHAATTICRQLDGIPLALELAAARTRSLSVEQVADRLTDRFRLLTGGDQTIPQRQRSLRGLLDWSYDLLEPREQIFFARLSVFAGGCNLEAATAICYADNDNAVTEGETWETLDLLDSLVEKSLLLTVPHPDGETRYRMLETLREYAREKLETMFAAATIQDRHHHWFLHRTESYETAMRGSGQTIALRQLERDNDNLRLALRGLVSGEERMRLAVAMFWHWYVHGHYGEGREVLEKVLQEVPDAPIAIRSRAMKALGDLCWAQGDMDAARRVHRTNLELQIQANDDRGITVTWNSLGLVDYHQGDCVRAAENYRKSLEFSRKGNEPNLTASILVNLSLATKDLGDFTSATEQLSEAEAIFRQENNRHGLGKVLHTLGLLAKRRGDYPRARQYVEEATVIDREANDIKGEAVGWHTLGEIASEEGEIDQAEKHFRDALERFDQLGARRFSAESLSSLGEIARLRGDIEQSERYLRDSMRIHHSLGERSGIMILLIRIAFLRAAQTQYEESTRLLAAALSEAERLQTVLLTAQLEEIDEILAVTKEVIGAEQFRERWQEGSSMSLENAISYSGLE